MHSEILPTELSPLFSFTSKSGKPPYLLRGHPVTRHRKLYYSLWFFYILATLKQNVLYKTLLLGP